MSRPNIPRRLTVKWLRDHYRSGAVTPEEVILEIIRRSDEDRAMNIWIEPPNIEAIQPYLARLQLIDRESSPLWGIPFAIKDNIDLAEVPTTAACPAFSYIPGEHAAVVERLLAAGAVPVGKTNLDQFATGLVGTRSPYGETHNAIKPELISGGSSSGSAVAVARGQAVFALGTDTAGSGRVPAALNGLVGYKPSLGAWSTKGVVPACASLDCVTVFAHTLKDALLVESCARGTDSSDPWSRSIARLPAKLPKKMLIPLKPLDFYGPYADEYRRAWEKAADEAKQWGIPICYIDCELFFEAASILYDGPWVAERWAALGEFVDSHADDVFPVTEQILRSGSSEKHKAEAVFKAMHRLQAYKLEARRLLEDAVLLMPTCGGTWTREQARLNPVAANSDMGRYTNHCNLLDLSAVAIPAGSAAPDIPFGITLFALADSEHLLVGAAELLTGEGAQVQGHESDQVQDQVLDQVQDQVQGQVQDQVLDQVQDQVQGQVQDHESDQVQDQVLDQVQDQVQGQVQGQVQDHESDQVSDYESDRVPYQVSDNQLSSQWISVAVCGLHMRGFPLEKQMLEHGARFVREAETAACYEMIKLPTLPPKPGLIKRRSGGQAIQLELWEMPADRFGPFAALIPSPLGIGKVEMSDGSETAGFICEGYAEEISENVTAHGGWRFLQAK